MCVNLGLVKLIGKSFLGLIVSISISNSAVMAQELRPQKEPADFFVAETVAGSIGTFLFGMMGSELLAPPLRQVLKISRCPTSWFNGYHPCLLPYQIGWFIGSSLGASFVVVKVGSSFGVTGNVAFAFVGAALGSILALSSVNWVGVNWSRLPPLVPEGIAFLALLTPATLSAIGFNLGATMEVKALSLTPNGLELVSTRLRW